MLRLGICRPFDSPWAIQLHLRSKPSNEWRPCVDYRKLNAYPIPNIQEFNYFLLKEVDLVRPPTSKQYPTNYYKT